MSDIIEYAGPSLAAAMVTYVANQTATLADSLSASYAASYPRSVSAIADIPDSPGAVAVSRSYRESEARRRAEALADRDPTKLSVPLVDLNAAIQDFSYNFLATANSLFPALSAAAASAAARAAAGIVAPTAAHYDNIAEGQAVDLADSKATRAAFAEARQQMEEAARRGYRYLPGAAQSRIGELYAAAQAESSRRASELFAETTESEYTLRLGLARAGLRTHAQILGGMTDAVTQILRERMAAEARATNAMVSILGERIDTSLLRFSHKARIDALIQRAADRFTRTDVAAADTGEIKTQDFKNARTTFDTYYAAIASQAATLYNQLRGTASLSGTDSDVTDYEVVGG